MYFVLSIIPHCEMQCVEVDLAIDVQRHLNEQVATSERSSYSVRFVNDFEDFYSEPNEVDDKTIMVIQGVTCPIKTIKYAKKVVIK